MIVHSLRRSISETEAANSSLSGQAILILENILHYVNS
jgi:hypothetical protein